MVRKGEYLERAVVIPSPIPLEGLYHRGPRSPGLVIAPPHPFEGGSMESAMIAELAWAVTRAGHPTLRFNYRGVGASQGTFDEGNGAYVDLLKAAHHLRICIAGEESEVPIAAAGIGLGAAHAARMAIESGFVISPLILISPDPGGLPITLPSYGGDLVLIQAEEEEPFELPHARCARVAGADRRFLRGMVDLGKIVAQTLTASGSLELLARLD